MNNNLLHRLKLNAIFCRVIDCGSMRKAAHELGMTAPAVSQFINQLESELDITLIYRTTRKISLSEAGKQYYEQSKQMLLAAEQADDVINDLKQSMQGELRISLPVGLATTPIAEALSNILDEQPELKLTLIASDEYTDPVAERIDIAIRFGKPADSGFIYHHLGDPAKHIFASPKYLAKHSEISCPKELLNHTWLGLRNSVVLNNIILQKENQPNFVYVPKLRLKFNDLNSMIAHVKQGFGLAVLPELEIKHLIESGELVQIFNDWNMDGYHLFALTMDKKQSLKVKIALDTLKQYFSQHSY